MLLDGLSVYPRKSQISTAVFLKVDAHSVRTLKTTLVYAVDCTYYHIRRTSDI